MKKQKNKKHTGRDGLTFTDEYIDLCIKHSLHSFAGNPGRWINLKKKLTNSDICNRINSEFGSQGGAGCDDYYFDYKSGKSPTIIIYLGHYPKLKSKIIKGATLVNRVRKIFKIKEPHPWD